MYSSLDYNCLYVQHSFSLNTCCIDLRSLINVIQQQKDIQRNEHAEFMMAASYKKEVFLISSDSMLSKDFDIHVDVGMYVLAPYTPAMP